MNQDPSSPDYPPRSSYPQEQAEPPPPSRRVAITSPTSQPYITYTLLAINVIIFLLQSAGDYLLGYDLVANMGLKVNELIVDGQYWRLFTPMFLHGSILHLGFNMYALFIFGPGLERFYKHGRFLLLFLLGGFTGNVFSFIFSASPSLGSSTAIFALLAAEGVFLYQNQQVFGGMARRALNNIIMIAIVNFLIGLSPGIDNWGHLGGLLGGAIFAWFGGPLLKVEGLAPDMRIVDGREGREVFLAAMADLIIFGGLAVMVIFMRGG